MGVGAAEGDPVVATANEAMPNVLAGSLAICALNVAAAVALMGVALAAEAPVKW